LFLFNFFLSLPLLLLHSRAFASLLPTRPLPLPPKTRKKPLCETCLPADNLEGRLKCFDYYITILFLFSSNKLDGGWGGGA